MYCSNCGNSVDKKLKYCNTCGQRISNQESKNSTPGEILDTILETVFWTAILSFGALVGLAAVLLTNGVLPEFVAIIATVYLATVFGICFTLLRQVPKLVDAKLNESRLENAPVQPAQLYSKSTAQLDESREPVESVTAQTTRSLDEVLIERK